MDNVIGKYGNFSLSSSSSGDLLGNINGLLVVESQTGQLAN